MKYSTNEIPMAFYLNKISVDRPHNVFYLNKLSADRPHTVYYLNKIPANRSHNVFYLPKFPLRTYLCIRAFERQRGKEYTDMFVL
jgi:hypothetical protein